MGLPVKLTMTPCKDGPDVSLIKFYLFILFYPLPYVPLCRLVLQLVFRIWKWKIVNFFDWKFKCWCYLDYCQMGLFRLRLLCLIMPDPRDVESFPKRRVEEEDYQKLRRALCKGYGNQLAERMMHHNGYRSIGFRSQLVQVPASSSSRASWSLFIWCMDKVESHFFKV